MYKCKWLPDIKECNNFNEWNNYLKELYIIFENDFITSIPSFEKKPVRHRKAPMDGNYEHAFIHLTHKNIKSVQTDPNDRVPDPRRAERLGWTRKIIEKFDCNEECKECNKIKYYEKYYKNNIRSYFLFEDVRFLVIIEKRENYNLLITSYYIEYDYMLDKYIKEYEKFEKQKTPLT